VRTRKSSRWLLVLSVTVLEVLKGEAVLGGLRDMFTATGTERDGSNEGMV
jgi:hypothetical protein